MTRPRLLITGATGLIGARLVDALERGSIETHRTSRTLEDSPRTHRADLRVPEQVETLVHRVQPSLIVHLAGGRERDLTRLYESNLVTTVNVLNAATRLRFPPSVIVTGSAAEYGEPAGGIASESDSPLPVTDYGRAKTAASVMARTLAEAAGMSLCVVRPFNIVSEELPDTSALGNMRRQLLTGKGPTRPVLCGRLDIVRDYVPLPFVVDVLEHLLRSTDWPPTLNVCSGVGIELGDILKAMGEELQVDTRPVQDPALAAIPAASTIVGDTGVLRELGLSCEPTARSLAAIMLGSA